MFLYHLKKVCKWQGIGPNEMLSEVCLIAGPSVQHGQQFFRRSIRSQLRQPTVVYLDLIKHVFGPFYYTTPLCDEPNTNQTHAKESKYY